MKADNATATKRLPGLPASAMPGYISFVFLASVGPFFYAFFGYLFATASSNDASFKPIETTSYVYFVWLIIFLAFILRPAVNGRTGGIKLTRLVGYASLGLYGAPFAASLAMLARGTDAQRFLSYIFFGLPLFPFIPATYFLTRALANQPWFNPNATPEEIGPSLGAIADTNNTASHHRMPK